MYIKRVAGYSHGGHGSLMEAKFRVADFSTAMMPVTEGRRCTPDRGKSVRVRGMLGVRISFTAWKHHVSDHEYDAVAVVGLKVSKESEDGRPSVMEKGPDTHGSMHQQYADSSKAGGEQNLRVFSIFQQASGLCRILLYVRKDERIFGFT